MTILPTKIHFRKNNIPKTRLKHSILTKILQRIFTEPLQNPYKPPEQIFIPILYIFIILSHACQPSTKTPITVSPKSHPSTQPQLPFAVLCAKEVSSFKTVNVIQR